MGGQSFADTDAVGAALDAPGKPAVAELFICRDDLWRAKLFGLAEIEAPGIVLFGRAGALYPHPGKLDLKKIVFEPYRLALAGKGDTILKADIQPSLQTILLDGCIELDISRAVIPYLRIDAKNGAQRCEALGQYGPQPALLDAVRHNELLYLHFLSLLDHPPDARGGVIFLSYSFYHDILQKQIEPWRKRKSRRKATGTLDNRDAIRVC